MTDLLFTRAVSGGVTRGRRPRCNKPEHSDAFIISVIGLSNVSRQDFNSTVGSGSSSQDLFGEDIIIFFTSSAVAGSNDTSKEFTQERPRLQYLNYDLGKQNG